jgi:hypothetical protein
LQQPIIIAIAIASWIFKLQIQKFLGFQEECYCRYELSYKKIFFIKNNVYIGIDFDFGKK